MREFDERRLAQPYPTSDRHLPPEQLWADAVGVSVPCLRSLVREILVDLDQTTFGVRWWSPQVDTRRRILIGDYLFQCSKSIEINLVEAAIHRLEALDAFERAERSIRVVFTRTGPTVAFGPPTSAAADLHVPLADMHVAGFFRGVGSALDCLGAAMVGILALRVKLQFADYGRARDALTKVEGTTEGARIQSAFRSMLEAAEIEVGPVGWLKWTIDYRNALVHKARRLLAVQVTSRSGLLDARGLPISRAIHHPPRDPAFSEVDMWRDPERADALSEDVGTTLEGVQASAIRLVERLAGELLAIWRVRRASPDLLKQPAEKQWPDEARPKPTDFPGYSPGDWPYQPAVLVSSGEIRDRIVAAALPDATRDRVWR